jgi:hypothetical protein
MGEALKCGIALGVWAVAALVFGWALLRDGKARDAAARRAFKEKHRDKEED